MHELSTIQSAKFEFKSTPLADVWHVKRRPMHDARGFFARFYCAQEFGAIGITASIVQMNQSRSAVAGTVRGMHFQHVPVAETKIVTCIHGRIFDVALDLRAGSPSFMHWFGVELSADNQESLIVPPGVAHGFQTMEKDSEVLYLVTAPYSAEHEDGVNPFDPAAGISWPLAVAEVSARDAERPVLNLRDFGGIAVTSSSVL